MLEKHKSKFGEDFSENKKSLDEIAIVRSKGLKNEVAGYITNFIKKENRETEFNESQVAPSEEAIEMTEEKPEINPESENESQENVIEVGIDTEEVQESTVTSEEKTE